MRNDVIIQHEHWQPLPFDQFIAAHWRRMGHGPLPGRDAVRGAVQARINQGRWLVECPHDGCGGATVVSVATPRFVCVECGSPENEGHWYAVTFPLDRAGIEAELLQRPARDGWHATTRNWIPGETLADLRRETLARGPQ